MQSDEYLISFAGRIDEAKGAVTAAQIVRELDKRGYKVKLFLAGTGHYDGSAGAIKAAATNTTATSSDITAETRGTSGFVILELRKDEAYTG